MIFWYVKEYSFLCVIKFVYLKTFNQNAHRDSVIFNVSKKLRPFFPILVSLFLEYANKQRTKL